MVLSAGVVDGILREAEQGYDLMLLGATRESFIDRLIFGNLPQMLASRSPLPVIIVRRPRTAAGGYDSPPALAIAQCPAAIEHG